MLFTDFMVQDDWSLKENFSESNETQFAVLNKNVVKLKTKIHLKVTSFNWNGTFIVYLLIL